MCKKTIQLKGSQSGDQQILSAREIIFFFGFLIQNKGKLPNMKSFGPLLTNILDLWGR